MFREEPLNTLVTAGSVVQMNEYDLGFAHHLDVVRGGCVL